MAGRGTRPTRTARSRWRSLGRSTRCRSIRRSAATRSTSARGCASRARMGRGAWCPTASRGTAGKSRDSRRAPRSRRRAAAAAPPTCAAPVPMALPAAAPNRRRRRRGSHAGRSLGSYNGLDARATTPTSAWRACDDEAASMSGRVRAAPTGRRPPRVLRRRVGRRRRTVITAARGVPAVVPDGAVLRRYPAGSRRVRAGAARALYAVAAARRIQALCTTLA